MMSVFLTKAGMERSAMTERNEYITRPARNPRRSTGSTCGFCSYRKSLITKVHFRSRHSTLPTPAWVDFPAKALFYKHRPIIVAVIRRNIAVDREV